MADEYTRRAMPSAAWPGIVAGIAMTLLLSGVMTRPWLGIPGALAVLILGGYWALRLRHEQLSQLGTLTIVTAVLIGWLVNLLSVGPAYDIPYLAWMAWAGSSMLLLVCLQMRLLPALGITLVWSLVQLVGMVLHFDSLSLTDNILPTIGPASGELLVGVFALAMVNRMRAGDEAHTSTVHQINRMMAASHQQIEIERHWSSMVTAQVLPTLREIIDGKVDPRTPELIAKADLWAASTRDELAIGPDEPELLEALFRTRSRGWDLGSSLAPESDHATLARLAMLLNLLGTPATLAQMACPSISGTQASVVVLDPSDEQVRAWDSAAGLIGATVLADEGFVQLCLSA